MELNHGQVAAGPEHHETHSDAETAQAETSQAGQMNLQKWDDYYRARSDAQLDAYLAEPDQRPHMWTTAGDVYRCAQCGVEQLVAPGNPQNQDQCRP
jgi:hypothetical protein